MSCEWLPQFYEYPDWNNYAAYEKKLYSFFRAIYILRLMNFKGTILRYRRHPIIENREELYYHLTCCDYNKEKDRMPDPERIIRIEWTRAFIENYLCYNTCCNSKPMYWIKKYNTCIKHKIFHNDFLIVIEERVEYYLLITGHYINEEYYRRDLKNEYERNKN